MKLSAPAQQGKLVRRYKRFLADIELENGEILTVHTPNTGSTLGCAEPGTTVWIYDTQNPSRKYQWSWEIASTPAGVKVGIHTGLANKLVREAIENGVIRELQGYTSIRSEVSFVSSEKSRFDLFLHGHMTMPDCYVEVKNVTALRAGTKTAIFPDAVTSRGLKHLYALAEAVRRGMRGVMCYCVQRGDVDVFAAAHEIDPVYAEALQRVARAGVEVIAYRANVEPDHIALDTSLPVKL